MSEFETVFKLNFSISFPIEKFKAFLPYIYGIKYPNDEFMLRDTKDGGYFQHDFNILEGENWAIFHDCLGYITFWFNNTDSD